MIALADVLSRLDDVRRSGRGFVARCPAHPDRRPSLSVRARDGGGVLLYCFGGCRYGEILRALGVESGPADPRASRPTSVLALGLRIARSQRWADPLNREHMAVARAIRKSYRIADSLRQQATALGPTPAALDALALAATHERIARSAEMALDEILQ